MAPPRRPQPRGSPGEAQGPATQGTDPTMSDTRNCIVCGDRLDRRRGARGDRCGTCDRHWHRHGTDRPDDLVIKLTERDIERALTRRANFC